MRPDPYPNLEERREALAEQAAARHAAAQRALARFDLATYIRAQSAHLFTPPERPNA